MQVTTDDERFYIRESKDPVTGLPCHIYLPSATWICGYTPKGIGYYKWLSEHGWDESQAIMRDRGKYGSRVHNAIEMLLNGEDVKYDDDFADPYAPEGQAAEHMAPLTFEEYHAVWTFEQWWKEYTASHTVEILATETTIWNEALGFAGTIDFVAKVDGVHTVFDWKTSKNVFNSHVAQISAYREHMIGELKTDQINVAILQIGYPHNKRGYKLNELDPHFEWFEAAKTFWAAENDGSKPFQKDYPLALSLAVKKNMSKQTKVKNDAKVSKKSPAKKKAAPAAKK